MKPIIELIYDEPKFKIDTDNMIYEAVQSVGVNVDKDRLVKALIDSRSFYEEGYADAKKKYDKKWIPCSEKPPEEQRPTDDYQLTVEELETMMIHVGAIIEELANLYLYEDSCYYQQIKDKLQKQKEMWEEEK